MNPTKKYLRSGYLAVSDGHQLYYETYGDPAGLPVLFLHGGPGVGFSDHDKRFFDPAKFRVLFFDQRGAGRSRPYGELAHNSSQKLVEDIVRLLDHFDLPEIILFGGSWGSTLALLFGIQHPGRVQAMVLRGIFPANRRSIDYFLQGETLLFFPEAWRRFSGQVPPRERHDIAGYYLKQMQSDEEATRRKYIFEWSFYGAQLARMGADPEKLAETINPDSAEAEAKLEAYFSANTCFLPDDYIYDNAHKIGDTPVRIVQGRYDMFCPPVLAYELHERLPNSRLRIVEAGHAASEPAIEAGPMEELENFFNFPFFDTRQI